MHPSHRQVSKEKKKEKTTTHRHIRHQRIPLSITHTRECQPHKRHSTNKQSNTKSHTHTQPQGTKHASPITTTTLKHSPTHQLFVMIRQPHHRPNTQPITQKQTQTNTTTRKRMRPSHHQVSQKKSKYKSTQTQAHSSAAYPTITNTHTRECQQHMHHTNVNT